MKKFIKGSLKISNNCDSHCSDPNPPTKSKIKFKPSHGTESFNDVKKIWPMANAVEFALLKI
jgi:hypothetical protein